MTLSFNELRRLGNSLSEKDVRNIAKELGISKDTVKNYFGGASFKFGKPMGIKVEPGPDGGVVQLHDTRIYNLALKMLAESQNESTPLHIYLNVSELTSEDVAQVISLLSSLYKEISGDNLIITGMARLQPKAIASA